MDGGGGRSLDLREELAAIEAPALVLAGDDDAWAPQESVREVADALGGETVFRSFPDARHSIFLDAPAAYEELERFLDGLDAGDPEMKVRAGDIDLFFDVDGPKLVLDGLWTRERPTVLLLHTGPGLDHSLHKERLGPALARDAQVVYLDQRGSGRSDWSSEEHWTLDTWVEDVANFCDVLELERPMVLGTGHGGFVALLYAARHPERVERLVLVSAVAREIHTRVIAIFDRLGGPEAGDVAARYFSDPSEATFAEYLRVCVPLYTRTPLPPESVARMVMNSALSANWDRSGERHFDLRPEAGLVRCPTLLLAGEDDPGASLVGAEELRAALPPELVTFHSFPNVGHGVFRDAPEAVELVRDFLFAAQESTIQPS